MTAQPARAGTRTEFNPVRLKAPYKYKPIPYGPPIFTRGQKIMAAIEGVAYRHGLTVADMMSKERSHPLAHPRQEVMFVLRERFGLSFPRIGQILNNRHHTTIMHGVRRHKERANGLR